MHRELEPRILLKKVGVLGADDGDLKELRILNRVLRWMPWGIAYEADPRHAELLAQALGAEKASRSTPGVKPSGDMEAQPLDPENARLFRAYAARANYLGMDRLDIAFAAKELCRRMSSPDEADLEALRRLIQYLVGAPGLFTNSPGRRMLGSGYTWILTLRAVKSPVNPHLEGSYTAARTYSNTGAAPRRRSPYPLGRLSWVVSSRGSLKVSARRPSLRTWVCP